MRLLGTQAEPESETAETREAHGSIVWLNTPQSRANTTESRSWGQDLGGLLDIRQIDFEACFEAGFDGTYGVICSSFP